MTNKSDVASEVVEPEIREINELVVATPEFAEFREGMVAMFKAAHNVTFDLTKTKDNEAARRLRKQLVASRSAVERRRTEKNREDRASIQQRIAQRDAGAQRLIEIIQSLETPLDEQITADEERREREAQAKREAEEARITYQRQRVEDIMSVGARAIGATPDEIEAKIALVGRIEIGADYEEFAAAAANAKADTLARLQELLADAKRLAAERAEAERNKAELERLRAADAERQARERAEAQAREQAEREARERAEAEARERQAQMRRAMGAVERIQKLQRTAATLTVAGLQALVAQIREAKPDGEIGEYSGMVEHARELALAQIEATVQLKEQQAAAAAREAEAEAQRRSDAQKLDDQRRALETLQGCYEYMTGAWGQAEPIRGAIADLESWHLDADKYGPFVAAAESWRNAKLIQLRAALEQSLIEPPPLITELKPSFTPAADVPIPGETFRAEDVPTADALLQALDPDGLMDHFGVDLGEAGVDVELLAIAIRVMTTAIPCNAGYAIHPDLFEELVDYLTGMIFSDGRRIRRDGTLAPVSPASDR